MNWIEQPETRDKYRTLIDDKGLITIVDKPNASEMVCQTEIHGIVTLTTFRDCSISKLQLLAEALMLSGMIPPDPS